jgi:NADH:ubiquinone oxidoreductase subunit F (NADH-binding)
VIYGKASSENIENILEDYFLKDAPSADLALAVTDGEAEGIPKFSDLPVMKEQVRIVLRNCGVIDPGNLDHYIARGGYAGLERALGMTPVEVIDEVKKSGLRGRGGAGFPTGMKWEFCHKAQGDAKYVICNADEGDPGAFMDRSVIESDPHAVLEGLCIAAYAIGAGNGYIYVRAEYPLAIVRLEKAIAQAREAGLIGKNILGSGFDFDIRIKKGAGAFVCGEETALLASIEGHRGMPRPRPPFPAQSGLHGKPTNINNVETLANVPFILREGHAAFSKYGTDNSKGTKTFALAGKVERTGLIEVPLGLSLRDIVFGVGGGVANGKRLKAVQTGGPSGGCIPESLLDTPVDYQRLAEIGAIMGSGGMIVMDEDTCMVDVARYFIGFTQEESCGKCVPCRLGTRQMLEILTDITVGRAEEGALELLEEIANGVKAGSLCGLGQTAPNPILTTLKYYRREYEDHVKDRVCPAARCAGLVTFEIYPDECVGCGICKKACPSRAIAGERKQPHSIDQSICTTCGVCFEACKFGSIRKLGGRKK